MTVARRDRDLIKSRSRRLRWFREARFGMFVHWGLYSQLARHEWVMNRECIPVKEYEKFADTWRPKPQVAREWVKLARRAQMKYMVFTAKHHEGFCLWDSRQTDYTSVKRGPKRDLVGEYIEAGRQFGLKIGLYYSLMDWHHPDGGKRCLTSAKARRRFLDFTQGCVRELCSNYGKIDILWYDMPHPLSTVAQWESAKMNRMARSLQPDILINNRAVRAEDFATPEGNVTPAQDRRAWESCMTMNGAWGYMPSAGDWVTPRQVVKDMLLPAARSAGNLLLNIGPRPDGSVPSQASDCLDKVGVWVKKNAEALYGPMERVGDRMEVMHTGDWTIKGHNAYFWCYRWPGAELVLPAMRTKVKTVCVLATGKPVSFSQQGPNSYCTTWRELILIELLPSRYSSSRALHDSGNSLGGSTACPTSRSR